MFRVRSSRLALLAAFLWFPLSFPALAAREGYTRLSYAGSDVALLSSDQEDTQARANMPVMAGDKLQTGASSRAEAILSDGNVVRVDGRTDLRFDRLAHTYQTDDDRDLLFLERGAIAVEVRFASSFEQALRVDTEDATVVFPEAGSFRIDTGRRGTEIYVESGHAEVTARVGRTTVQAGEYAYVSGDEAVEVEDGGFPRDRFARFCEERHRRTPRAESARYVGADYEYDVDDADFDDYGSWVYVASVGRNCWRPSVGADWRPYSLGSWRWTPCGLTWVSYEPWGWLPYHYGTWCHDLSFGWYWLPGLSYSPAWVYWSYTPSYIGWCPVGYYGYYDNYYRSTRTWYGREGQGGMVYPHLTGRVEVTQIDPRGWNFVPTGRLGSRLDPPRDILRGDRVPFRAGEIAVVETAPLRIDRVAGSGGVVAAVQDAVRRVPVRGGAVGVRPSAGIGVSEGLTSILKRESRLTPAAEQVLRGAYVRADRDANYRPVSPEAVAGPRRGDTGAGVSLGVRPGVRPEPIRRGDFDRETAGVRPGAGVGPVPRSSGEPIRRESWRDTPRPETGLRRGEDARHTETPVRPAPRGDDGWRAQGVPAPRPVERRSEERPAPRREDSGWRAPAPQPVPSQAREPESRPAPRSSEPPRREMRSYEAPQRYQAPPPRSYEAPQPRHYETPRHEAPPPRPEPRSGQSFHSYQPPPRIEYRPAPAAPAPAPRNEAPASRPAPPSRRG